MKRSVRDVVISVLVSLILQSGFPKLKEWIHKHTAPPPVQQKTPAVHTEGDSNVSAINLAPDNSIP